MPNSVGSQEEIAALPILIPDYWPLVLCRLIPFRTPLRSFPWLAARVPKTVPDDCHPVLAACFYFQVGPDQEGGNKHENRVDPQEQGDDDGNQLQISVAESERERYPKEDRCPRRIFLKALE